MLCPKCKQELQEEMQYCPHCGLKIERCPVCKNAIILGSKYCSSCGTKLNNPEYGNHFGGYYEPIQDDNKIKEDEVSFKDVLLKKKINRKVIIISVSALVILSGLSYWYLNYGPSFTNQLTQPETVDTFKKESIQIQGETQDSSLVANLNQNGYVAFNGEKLFVCDNQKKVIVMDKNLENQEVFLDEEVNYLQIAGNTLYYTDSQHRMCSIDIDGKNQKNILDKEVYYPVVKQDKIYYQLNEDNESIYVYDFSTKKETKLNSRASYELNVVNDKIYYSSKDGIYQIGVDGKGDEKLVSGAVFNLVYQDNKLYYTSQDDVNIKVFDLETKKEDTLIQEKSQLLNITSDSLFYQTSDMQVARYDLKENKADIGLYSGRVNGGYIIGDKLILDTVSSLSSNNNYKVIMDFDGDNQQRLFINDSGSYV